MERMMMEAHRITTASIMSPTRKFKERFEELAFELLLAVTEGVEEEVEATEVVDDAEATVEDEIVLVEVGVLELVTIEEVVLLLGDDCTVEAVVDAEDTVESDVDVEEDDTPEPGGPTETMVTISVSWSETKTSPFAES